jgi:hypothetical protein
MLGVQRVFEMKSFLVPVINVVCSAFKTGHK